jgi:hypothetical protein
LRDEGGRENAEGLEQREWKRKSEIGLEDFFIGFRIVI